MNNLLIVGAGQFGCVAKEIAESMNKYDKIDFLDDSNPIAIGKVEDYLKFKSKYKYFCVAIGNSKVREQIIEKLEKYFVLESIISPKSYISKSALIGSGTIIEAFAIINTEAKVGKSSLICSHSIINHNAEIEDFCHINCGAIVKSNSKVIKHSKIDYGKIV